MKMTRKTRRQIAKGQLNLWGLLAEKTARSHSDSFGTTEPHSIGTKQGDVTSNEDKTCPICGGLLHENKSGCQPCPACGNRDCM